MESLQNESERRRTLQLTAYYLWQQRGCPFGAPEVDWFRAEEELRESESAARKPAIVAVAETVGSALGSVAGLVATVGNLVRTEDTSGSE